MSLLDKLKTKGALWALESFSDEKYKVRRWLLVKLARNYLDKHFFEGGDSMEGNIEGKSKWKSKSVWTAIVTVLIGAIEPISTALGTPIVVPPWIYTVLASFGLYSLRDGAGKPIK